MDSSQKRSGYLTYQGTTKLPMPTDRDAWAHCEVVKDLFWSTVSKQTLRTVAPSERDKEAYRTFSEDNNDGDDIFISPRSLLRMRVEKTEPAYSAICFESKSQSNHSYDSWVRKVMAP